jgi:hypothetical protein
LGSGAAGVSWSGAGCEPEFKQFEHRGHSLTIDRGWKEVADAILAWLTAQGL